MLLSGLTSTFISWIPCSTKYCIDVVSIPPYPIFKLLVPIFCSFTKKSTSALTASEPPIFSISADIVLFSKAIFLGIKSASIEETYISLVKILFK